MELIINHKDIAFKNFFQRKFPRTSTIQKFDFEMAFFTLRYNFKNSLLNMGEELACKLNMIIFVVVIVIVMI